MGIDGLNVLKEPEETPEEAEDKQRWLESEAALASMGPFLDESRRRREERRDSGD